VSPAITEYTEGQGFIFQANHTPSSSVTVGVSGLTNKNLVDIEGNAYIENTIQSGDLVMCVYDGTNFVTPYIRSIEVRDYTPTLGVSGGTFTSTTTTYARYSLIGKQGFIYIYFNGTTGTTPDYLTFTAPLDSANTSVFAKGAVNNAGTVNYATACFFSSASTVKIYPDAEQSAYADGSTFCYASIHYEVDA